ncbi:DUF3093 domain-containing protein [Gordonia sp. HY285]|uniref:DUF3093 domain-containing protein n=1 Tax=Gordonia liuliyuniae TaxID=2911517 RepID=UPI001F409A1F|nr:DUF3093 domain-containing protein [Gordonia liuliyuniae]MCF8611979.1 DUF3093 domain-containing protein [Gordonia liuliyuniae]
MSDRDEFDPADRGDTDGTDTDGADTPETEDSEVAAPAERAPEVVERGEELFYEEGGSKWVIVIGPVMLALTLALEIAGGGRIHWEVLTIFGVILIGFSIMQVIAARRHVSVRLTDCTLRQGTRVTDLDDIAKVYPENTGPEAQDWESAPALGELHAVPRRRKGVGVKLTNGRLAQAWARDVDRFRVELTEAHLAVKMGLPPKGTPPKGTPPEGASSAGDA